MSKKNLFIAGVVCSTFLLAACNNEEEAVEEITEEVTEETTEESVSSETTEAEIVESDAVVATVNGEEITGSKYNDMYSQTLLMFQQNGQDATDEAMVQEQTLSRLIEQELLMQEVETLGIEAPSSEIEERLEQIKSQFENEEQFEEQLAQLDLTEQALEDQLAYEIRVNKYIEQEVPEVEIDENEVQAYYDQLVSQQGEQVPALEEVRDQIEEVLMNQRRQTNFASMIEILKEESEIETLI
ncbi:SurA N-terminal domain-containing protein [Bacillus suaedae]|uniref:peptidylprolyl isomerase n=1 Tax=Halalkalibacter suaedae TaxID=2822140 RepID=A0A940WWH5_9BACI|nr:SurA N-terminal domain-containing protein [Bacillus suaedae]MBP3951633.1 SurA N-terminal domain-containing protein [Bacillus suaedae]